MRVRASQSGLRLIDFLSDHHPPTPRERWIEWLDRGDIRLENRTSGVAKSVLPDADLIVAGGERFVHRQRGVVEPAVRATIGILHEDDSLLVVDKPAPLPMHASGRYNRNTLLSLVQSVYTADTLRVAHRLDANTSGVVVLTRNALAATSVQAQFASRTVRKQYLARVIGHCPWASLSCDQPIAVAAGQSDFSNTHGAWITHPSGQSAVTQFDVIAKNSDGTTLVSAVPITGRTNQIRVHLWSIGFPIVGDPMYLPEQQLGNSQTLAVDDPPMCLRATRISLDHPNTGEEVTFVSELEDW